MNGRSRLYHIMYAFMALTICFLIISVAVRSNMYSPTDELSEDMIAFDENWTLENGMTVDLDYLNKTNGVKVGRQFSIYSTLPDKLPEGLSLCFRTKNIFYKVYIDGKLRYEPEVEVGRDYVFTGNVSAENLNLGMMTGNTALGLLSATVDGTEIGRAHV